MAENSAPIVYRHSFSEVVTWGEVGTFLSM